MAANAQSSLQGEGHSIAIQSFTATEAGAWSNSYLVSGQSEAVLFDVFMLHSDTVRLADEISRSGKTLTTVLISHAHPDHFMGLDVIVDRFPNARVVATSNVIADIKSDAPWMLAMLQAKLGPDGPGRLVIPEALDGAVLTVDGRELRVVEYGECEGKHIAAVYIPDLKAMLSADLIYNDAHLYLQERHIEGWLARLDELEAFAARCVDTIYPGHGGAAGLELIERNRAYMREFLRAVKSGDSNTATQMMLDKYPEYHVRQFLTAFSIPAYFPAATPE